MPGRTTEPRAKEPRALAPVEPPPPEPVPPPPVDPEGLFVALTLDPSLYSRNRAFALYADHRVRDARRRAARVRSVARALVRMEGERALAKVDASLERQGEAARLTLAQPLLATRRVVWLDPLELATLRFVLARAAGGLACDDADRARVEAAAARLLGHDPWRSPSFTMG